MNFNSTATIAAIALALLPAVGNNLANATSHDEDGDTIHLVEQIHDFAFLDEGSAGPSLGDRLVFTSDLFDRNGNPVGRDAADCVTVRDPGQQQIAQCTITVQLSGGEITFQGLAQGTDNTFAITGGTGEYKNARGEAVAKDRVPLQTADITIRLIR